MKRLRSAIAAGVLAGFAVGCSGSNAPTKPANAVPPSEEKPLPAPSAKGGGGGPGPKQRPPG